MRNSHGKMVLADVSMTGRVRSDAKLLACGSWYGWGL